MGVRGNVCDLSLLPLMRLPCPSFRRKTESSLFTSLLDPGFRRGDDRTHGLVLKSQALGVRGKGLFSKPPSPGNLIRLKAHWYKPNPPDRSNRYTARLVPTRDIETQGKKKAIPLKEDCLRGMVRSRFARMKSTYRAKWRHVGTDGSQSRLTLDLPGWLPVQTANICTLGPAERGPCVFCSRAALSARRDPEVATKSRRIDRRENSRDEEENKKPILFLFFALSALSLRLILLFLGLFAARQLGSTGYQRPRISSCDCLVVNFCPPLHPLIGQCLDDQFDHGFDFHRELVEITDIC